MQAVCFFVHARRTSAAPLVYTACFSQVFPPKQNIGALELVFDTARGLEQPLRLALSTECKGCLPGQRTEWRRTSANATNATGPCSLPFDCVPCNAPTYSFIPEAEQCSVCPPRSVCNAYYAVPINGSYQTHPRSPLVSRQQTLLLSTILCAPQDSGQHPLTSAAVPSHCVPLS